MTVDVKRLLYDTATAAAATAVKYFYKINLAVFCIKNRRLLFPLLKFEVTLTFQHVNISFV